MIASTLLRGARQTEQSKLSAGTIFPTRRYHARRITRTWTRPAGFDGGGTLVVDLPEVEVRGEADENLGQGPLDRGDQVGTAVERVQEHCGCLADVDLEDDLGPLVEVGSAPKDVGEICIFSAKVVSSEANHC